MTDATITYTDGRTLPTGNTNAAPVWPLRPRAPEIIAMPLPAPAVDTFGKLCLTGR